MARGQEETSISQVGRRRGVTPQLGIGCQVRVTLFLFFLKLITFTLAYSHNVKYLTCIILCSSGLQNIYTSSIYGSVQHLQ